MVNPMTNSTQGLEKVYGSSNKHRILVNIALNPRELIKFAKNKTVFTDAIKTDAYLRLANAYKVRSRKDAPKTLYPRISIMKRGVSNRISK